MKTLYIASNNKHKIRELEQMFSGKNFIVKSLSDFPKYQSPKETGKNFMENAHIKALALRKKIDTKNVYILADDSGLECEDLEGAPGIYSARFSGDNATDDQNNKKLIEKLKTITHLTRAVRYVCALVLITPDGKQHEIQETCEGLITFEPKGKNGFGYDPYFYLPSSNKTMAELDLEQKNQISHRGKALRKMYEIIFDKA
jgi:XTP/dITP diphosphohydrolase